MNSDSPVKDGFMIDAEGRHCPVDTIKPEHILEDTLVRELVAEAEKVSALLTALRGTVKSSVTAYLELVGERYGVTKGGPKGNLTLKSFDGLLQLKVAIGDFIDFGPELQIAKGLLDQYLDRISAGADSDLRRIVMETFNVNQEGKIDKDRILSLRRIAIEDDLWSSAMTAISDSVRVTRTKEYFRLYRKAERGQNFEQIPLNLASV